MRFAPAAVLTLALAGCSDGIPSLPTTPAPIPRETAFVWVVVYEAGGGGECVRGATVEVVGGQALGRRIQQPDICSVWDPDYTALFQGLTPGVEMTLRASAPGYDSVDREVIPKSGPQYAVEIGLPKTP